MKRYVVDANYLNSSELEEYLRSDKTHYVILHTGSIMEACGRISDGSNYDFIKNLKGNFSIIGNYPAQVFFTKEAQDVIFKLKYSSQGLQRRLLNEDLTFKKFYSALSNTQSAFDKTAQIKTISPYFEGIYGQDILKMIESLRAIFPDRDLKDIGKLYKPFSSENLKKLDTICRMFLGVFASMHNINCNNPSNHYVYRYFLAECFLIANRFSEGLNINSQIVVDKLRNDIIDMSYIVYATYFDGLLTNDRRPKRIYQQLKSCLSIIPKTLS